MTNDRLTAILAERVMGWRVGPERFLMDGRRWIPRWRFQPLRQMAHALQLLETADASYSITKATDGNVTAAVTVNGRSASGSGESEPMALTLALVRALEIVVERID